MTVTPSVRVRGTVTTMRCRQCGHQNESGANFCSSCGSPLPQEDEATLSLTELAERLELDEELGAALAELPDGHGHARGAARPQRRQPLRARQRRHRPGRHPDSDIFLDDITVSRRHAAVRRVDGAYEVSDVGSLNGTYVDHKRVDTAPLHHLADLQIGRFVLVFLVGSDARETVPMSSREPEHLSIGEVLAELSDEFPDITISKIRFLESQGLVNPERTPSGYRKFYAADLTRLRWILYQQKEHFLPLKVIKERLDELPPGGEDRLFETVDAPTGDDARRDRSAVEVAVDAPADAARPRTDAPAAAPSEARAAPAPRPARRAPAFAPTLPARRRRRRRSLGAPDGDGRYTRAELAAAGGVDDAQVAQLESFGLLAPAREVDGDA